MLIRRGERVGLGSSGWPPAKINLGEGKTKFRGATGQGSAAVGCWEWSGPRRWAEGRELEHARRQWEGGGRWKLPQWEETG